MCAVPLLELKLALLDPSMRFAQEVAGLGDDCIFVRTTSDPRLADVDAVLVAPAMAREASGLTQPRWIIGDAKSADKVAGAAALAQARGVILTPARRLPEPPPAPSLERTRQLVALSIVDSNIEATLQQLADAFAGDNALVWWRRGDALSLTALRRVTESETMVAAAARIAAGTHTSVMLADGGPVLIAAPLYSANHEMMGFLAIVRPSIAFAAEEITDLRAISTRLGREMVWLAGHDRLLEDRENLRANSLIDPLTSALSRAGFEQTIATEITGARRRGEKLCLGILDIVGLGEINGLHGHKVGDEVLAKVTAQLRANLRGNDRVGRLGGDELGILLIGAREEQAKLVCDKLVRRIMESTPVVSIPALQVRVRMGVAELGAEEKDAAPALDRAWNALTQAKPGGTEAARDHGGRSKERTDLRLLDSGTIVGGTFRVLHELSRGAMGVVYRGEDLGLGRPVAIKVLRANLATDHNFVGKFRAEAALLASLHHQNLVQVYSLGEQDGDIFFVMELVEGQPLSSAIADHAHNQVAFPVDAAGHIALEIADALAAMHAIGVVHRDVKPANVLLDRNRDRAVLVDVGVAAKRGEQSEAAGTPGFAAPEAFLSSSDSPLVDVYGLGATVYCMLSGEPPFGAGNAMEVIRRQMDNPLPTLRVRRPEIPAAVDSVLQKAMDPDPAKRWQSATTFAMALSRALEATPASAPTSDAETPVLQWMESPDTAMGMVAANDRIRAVHYAGAAHVLRHLGGEPALLRLQTSFPHVAARLSADANALEWAPLDEFMLVLQFLAGLDPDEAIVESLGREVTQSNFAMFLGQDPRALSPEVALAASMAVWPKLHQWCDFRLTKVERASAEVEVSSLLGGALLCELLQGELSGAMLFAAPTQVSHTECRHRGGTRCAYHLSW